MSTSNSLLALGTARREFDAKLRGLRLRPRPRWLQWLGPTRHQRLAERYRAAYDLAAAPLIADYRANRFPSDVQWSAWQVSRSIEKPPGWGRFWLHPNVLKASELVFAHLSDVDVVERVGGATVADVGQALHDLDARLRRRSQQAPRVVRVALDYEEFPNAVPRDAIGLIGVDHSDGSWDEDTFLRYELKDSTGLIVKISCAEMIQGLGVATRMVETLLSTHPDVTTWHTTTKRVRQSAF